jgi:hypothetical protein
LRQRGKLDPDPAHHVGSCSGHQGIIASPGIAATTALLSGAASSTAVESTPFVTSSPIRVSRVEDSPMSSPGNQQAIPFVWCA